MESIEFKTSINISAAGGGCQMRLGDIDGDGRLELVLIKPDIVSDERYFSHSAAAITAYSADGALLWQVGNTENAAQSDALCDLPVQIYDIDKDGKNEVIAVMDGELLIFDGKTAEIKKQIELPRRDACDCIVIADLDGSGYAQNIILKNRYSHMWALDSNLNILWEFTGNIGHCPVAYDLNDDGREEIIAGYNVISSAGELLWKTEMPGHANSIAVDCLTENSDPTVFICGEHIRAHSASGELLWELPEYAENIALGKFRDAAGDTDILILDNMSLFGCNGEFLYEKNEIIHTPLPIPNFDDSGKLYIAGHKQEDICTTLYDGYMRPCYTIPFFGNIVCGDIIGSGFNQIIIFNDETAELYSFRETDLTEPVRPYTRQQPKQLYNVSVHNTLPQSRLSQGYVADDFAAQNILKWAETYASLNLHNSYAKVVRSEFVLLLANLLHLKEEFTENFSDVAKDSTYYNAVGTFRKLKILDSCDNLFMPDIPIAVAEANQILTRLSIPLSFGFDEKYELSKQDMARLIVNLSEA